MSVPPEELHRNVEDLAQAVEKARAAVQSWMDANSNLSLNAQEARAKNQARGRGVWSGLLGKDYQRFERQLAVRSNAAIAEEVAEKRKTIADGKRAAQETLRATQAALTEAKKQLRTAEAAAKKRSPTAKTEVELAAGIIDLLGKLKAARDAGVLSEQEYEEKRQRLLARL